VARLIVNDKDLTDKLSDFSLSCGKCGNKDVFLEIDTGRYDLDYLIVEVVCKNCGESNEILFED